jgi:uncharacterized membrane protein
MEWVVMSIEAAGVAIIVFGMGFAAWRFVMKTHPDIQHHPDRLRSYKYFRQDIGRSILLGLEFMIAGDIIRTVVVTATLASVGTLALVVLVRTFLSMTLHLEVEGCWPWQTKHESNPDG